MIVAGDYIVNTFEGTEQYAKPHRLVTHPHYNRSTNNADIMLIKVLQKKRRDSDIQQYHHCYHCLSYVNLFVLYLNVLNIQPKTGPSVSSLPSVSAIQ